MKIKLIWKLLEHSVHLQNFMLAARMVLKQKENGLDPSASHIILSGNQETKTQLHVPQPWG